jgi:cation:H+ antiporter
MMLSLILLAAGLALLLVGAELLVRGASRLATAVGISPLVIGLTVVAFGTSSPEIAVSVQSAFAGKSDLAIGNVVGSNIFNLLLILGLSAAITPLLVSRQLVRLDVPIMIAVSLLVLPLVLDGMLSVFDGGLLVTLLFAYIAVLVYLGRKEPAADVPSSEAAAGGWLVNVALVGGGLVLLVWGSRWLVAGALTIAQAMGVSELIIGLTIIAAGTSLPEVATSIIAAVRGQRDIAVGNVVGSCIFNVLAVLGLASLVAPNGVAVPASAVGFDIPIMIAVSVAAWPIFWSGAVISRGEGFLFLFYYAAYTSYLILHATEHDALPVFNTMLMFFVIPITLVTALLVAIRTRRDLELRRLSSAPPPT